MHACPRCQRANPAEAAFCYYDGAELRPAYGLGEAGRQTRLPHEFVFPTGRRCRSLEELALACQDEWDVARDLLRQGVFRQFLSTAGRLDLARAADEARGQLDPDVALDTFLGSLPARGLQTPRLDLEPRHLLLGTLHVGETRQVELTVRNQGKGLLHGSLAVADGAGWIRLAESKNPSECAVKTAREQRVSVKVDTRGLTAPHKYAAKLTLITNGGIFEVPVRLDLAVHPFHKAPFQGVTSPREMAEKMRAQPKPAVPLLESGDVARWFAVNGWSYPVLGPSARGVAAVQQFFEGMGLSKPPVVTLAEPQVELRCRPGEVAQGQATLRTDAKKWVYARADCEARWLRVTTPNVSGPQQAVLTFEVDPGTLDTGDAHETTVKIIANAGQSLSLPIRVRIERPSRVGRRPSRVDTPAAAVGLPAAGPSPLLVGVTTGFLCRLLLAIPADLVGRVLVSARGTGVAPGSFASWLLAPTESTEFLRRFVLLTWWLGALAGGLLLRRRDSRRTDLLFGVIAGGVAGLVASATFACLLPTLDVLPRFVWRQLAPLVGNSGGAWLWTPVWILTASLGWAVWGAAAGLVLRFAGETGADLVGRVGGLVARVFRLCGLRGLAARFATEA